ncbi:MAG: type II toxin-antitoxin system PrlF family antitoxin [Actinomycetaceae bacterium]|nr:type II toxin-antitoxin system PrlF family antitoxin [Actinomycetaceae bacterium]
MPAVLQAESTLTSRYQTTIPSVVRRALNLSKQDRIRYTVQSDGDVVLSRAEEPEEHNAPVLESFLAFLAKDIDEHPERLRPLDMGLLELARELTEGVEVDLNAPLPEDEE